MLDKYRNLQLILHGLCHVPIENLISFKCKYGYKIFDELLNKNLLHLINNNLPGVICKNIKYINNLDIIYEVCGNSPHYNFFIKTLNTNINKITKYNVKNVFDMFILTKINKFKGFTSWGPGNNKTSKLNIINHYNKHVKNNDFEDWSIYLKSQYITDYEEFAINKSYHMTNKIVHTNGIKVYLSGIYKNILIIGRLHEENLGISSCYIMNDESYKKKLKVFTDNTCFKI